MLVPQKSLEIDNGIVGVISDTHGLMRPEALTALKGAELIIHGGDIGKAEVLRSLSGIAPVYAIRGNNDRGAWAQSLPDILNIDVNGVKLHVIHNLHDLDCEPNAAGIRAVISGHSHQPSIVTRDNVLYVNPGSAGPRRFKLPVTIARLKIHRESLDSEIINLLK